MKHFIMRSGAIEISMYSLDLEHCFPYLYVRVKRHLKIRHIAEAVLDVDGKVLEGHLPAIAKFKVRKMIAANKGHFLLMWNSQTFYEIT